MKLTPDLKTIDLLRNIPDLIPVRWDNFEDWTIKIVDRSQHICKNYLSSNRRGFYKIVFLNDVNGTFTLGIKTYHINEPTLLFVHPNEIISWKNGDTSRTKGHFCIFNEKFITENHSFRMFSNKYGFFKDSSKSVIRLPADAADTINELFLKMHEEQSKNCSCKNDALQAYIQLIMVTGKKVSAYPDPSDITGDYNHIYDFFKLLEKETAGIDFTQPVRIKTAQEFAGQLGIHPNHLNVLLKKYTGQNLSIHIKNRLLEESKVLLLRTDWTLQQIAHAVGFAEQSNFSQFFKKNVGVTAAVFRKDYSA